MNKSSLLESMPDVVDADRSILKIVIVVALGILAAFLIGFFFESGHFIYALIAVFVFLVIFIFQNLFIKSFDKLFLADFLETIAIGTFFYKNFSNYFIIALIVLMLLLFKASYDSRKELEATLKIRFFRLSKLILNSAVPAVLVFLGVMFLVNGATFTEAHLNTLLRPAVPMIRQYIPNFSPYMSSGELFNQIALSSLSKEDLEKLESLPTWAKEQLTVESIDQIESRVEEFVGTDINSEETVLSSVYSIASAKIAGLSSGTKMYWGIGLVITSFFFVKGLLPILYPIITLITFIIYQILLATKFIVVQLESRSREIIVLE